MVKNITDMGTRIIGLYLGDYSKELHAREMSRLIGKSHVTLLPHLKKLEHNKILNVARQGKNKVYTLNLGNNQGREYLSIAEKLRSLAFIEKEFFIKKISDDTASLAVDGCLVVFGSYASGIYSKESDIDLLYLGNMNRKGKEAIRELGRVYKRNVHLAAMTLDEFKKALQNAAPLVKEIIKNHIVLHNQDIFVNIIWGYYEKKEK